MAVEEEESTRATPRTPCFRRRGAGRRASVLKECVGVGVGVGVEGRINVNVREGLELVGESSGGKQFGDQGKDQVEEEKKENDPYDVPTNGAFYVHDDRYQGNGRGRHQRMFVGQKLWDSKDEHAWVHDRFEEMNLQDRHRDVVSFSIGKAKFERLI